MTGRGSWFRQAPAVGLPPALFPTQEPAAGADVAYTPPPVASTTVDLVAAEISGAVVWEPYVGGGAFADALRSRARAVLVTDCDPAAPGLAAPSAFGAVHDVGRGLPVGWPRPDWIVTNPPFSLLDAHLPILLEVATRGVLLLLVGQWLAPGARDWLWDAATPDEVIWHRERIPFKGPGRTGKATDLREYAAVIWRRRSTWVGRARMGRYSTALGRVWRSPLAAE